MLIWTLDCKPIRVLIIISPKLVYIYPNDAHWFLELDSRYLICFHLERPTLQTTSVLSINIVTNCMIDIFELCTPWLNKCLFLFSFFVLPDRNLVRWLWINRTLFEWYSLNGSTRWHSPDGVVARLPGWRMGGFGFGRRGPTRAGRSHETRAGLGDRLLQALQNPEIGRHGATGTRVCGASKI